MSVYINMEMPQKTYAHCMLIKDIDGSVQLLVCTKNSGEISEWESEDKGEIFDRFKTVDRVFSDLGIHCAYDMPSFWCNKGKDYAVIETKYHKGYMQALKDVEKEVRLRFGFSERDNLISMPFDGFFKAEVDE